MSRCVSNFVPTRMGSRALPSFTADLAPAQHKPPRQRTVLQQTTRPSELTTPQAVMRAQALELLLWPKMPSCKAVLAACSCLQCAVPRFWLLRYRGCSWGHVRGLEGWNNTDYLDKSCSSA